VKVLCRDMVGKRVRLLRAMRTRGGTKFREGQLMDVVSTHRGRFELRTIRPSYKPGSPTVRKGIRAVDASAFEVVR